jgi:uncharacterized membrane-anchored protein
MSSLKGSKTTSKLMMAVGGISFLNALSGLMRSQDELLVSADAYKIVTTPLGTAFDSRYMEAVKSGGVGLEIAMSEKLKYVVLLCLWSGLDAFEGKKFADGPAETRKEALLEAHNWFPDVPGK